MRHSSRRQKRNGIEQDWCSNWTRRAFGLNLKPRLGKAVKKAMARRRRREPLPDDE